MSKFLRVRTISTMKSVAENLIDNLPNGPLDSYRRRATFNWKSLKLKLEGEDIVRFQKDLWTYIEKNPLFQQSNHKLTLDELRRRCSAQMDVLKNEFSILQAGSAFNYLFYYDPALVVKFGITYGMVPNAVFSLGTDQHNDIFQHLYNGDYIGSFALTEISHGTNVKAMRTTATYDVKTKSFIFHTPDFEAAKCWAAGLGKTATHAVLFANLITPDGKNRGLHPFIVPIRDPKTMLPFHGVTLGDMGEKIGLKGVDNGFALFNRYSVPKICLLNKTADVTEDGKYLSFMSENRRFGLSLGALSMGRSNITVISTMNASLAMIIAIRYCAVRKQFGPSQEEEWSVIEYQAQQWRLFPHLAAVYAMKIFSDNIFKIACNFQVKLLTGENKDSLVNEGTEIHALSCSTKPLCSWMARDAIQDCREACAGHGYLKVSRLGDIRADHDATCTYEGENNVLIQQASNWLLNQWQNVIDGKAVLSPLGSADFLTNAEGILRLKFKHTTIHQTMKLENFLEILQWLVCYYVKKTYERVQILKKGGHSEFTVRNDSQMFFARTLTLVYGKHALIKEFINCLQSSMWNLEEKRVLTKLCLLHAACVVEQSLGDLYAGGYVTSDSHFDVFLREGIMTLCKDLVNEAVALVDVLAPPDFVINSPLGMADGEVYKHLQKSFYKDKETFQRPTWWRELVQSKL
ncbi:peroxisomal acyl-coenzyme A oxidase 3 isoform X2 [Orussus abietinus]|uniref:peroxisomal acyl-coenzyme A oxidase 3 isoform X2 n=1 Tax=Orussus abietinus TaxID=222816 RepID=UPI0006250723|nr:peroxisomal acyl-coenzyme A oxidase 3 isoform X2 [Orussus abietinus]